MSELLELYDGERLVRDIVSRSTDSTADRGVNQWAESERVLPRQTSAEHGPWKTERTPFLRQPMDDLSADSDYQTIVMQAGTQLGKSESGLNWTGSVIQDTPAPMMVIQPTVDLAKRYSKQRIANMVAACDSLKDRVRDARGRDSGNTVLLKEFPGGILIITGANSAAGLASMPAKFIHADEVDDYPLDLDGQGPSLKIATARQDTFSRRKLLVTSSPKRPKKYSVVETMRLNGTDFRYNLPCPKCGHYQELVWRNDDADFEHGLQYFNNDPKTTVYVCANCAKGIKEKHKTEMLTAGVWVAKNPGRDIRSYLLPSLLSPLGWCSWETIATEHKEAKITLKNGDSGPLKTWTNTRLAQTYEEANARVSEKWIRDLAKKSTNRLGSVHESLLMLTAGVDTQDNRLEVSVYGYGPSEAWGIVDVIVLVGDPSQTEREAGGLPTVWDKLDAVIQKRYSHASAPTRSLGIEAVAIDSGGHFTHEVYQYARRRRKYRVHTADHSWTCKVFAIKGDSAEGLPIRGRSTYQDVNASGKILKSGVKLWRVGTESAKDWIFARLKRKPGEPGYFQIANDMPDDWFGHMIAEKRTEVKTARRVRMVWVCDQGERNEGWDCAVYALFAAHCLDFHKIDATVWGIIESRLTGEADRNRVGESPTSNSPPQGMTAISANSDSESAAESGESPPPESASNGGSRIGASSDNSYLVRRPNWLGKG